MNCTTANAKIYYSLTDGSPQTLYTGPVTYDASGLDLAASPITFYMAAVEEGYDDAGIVSVTYPPRAPAFTTMYKATVGNDVTFAATSAVTVLMHGRNGSDNITSAAVKYPGDTSYTVLDKSKITVNNSAETITFDKSLFSSYGTHSFLICADGYANKVISLSMQKTIPSVNTTDNYIGSNITLSFADTTYQTGITASICTSGSATSVSIPGSYLTQTTGRPS